MQPGITYHRADQMLLVAHYVQLVLQVQQATEVAR